MPAGFAALDAPTDQVSVQKGLAAKFSLAMVVAGVGQRGAEFPISWGGFWSGWSIEQASERLGKLTRRREDAEEKVG
jgi:hypothetical protein